MNLRVSETDRFIEWLSSIPAETLSERALQHVVIQRGARQLDTLCIRFDVLDHAGSIVAVIDVPQEIWVLGGLADYVAEHLLHGVMCADCGTRLQVGEWGLCSPCEAAQILDVVRIARELACDAQQPPA